MAIAFWETTTTSTQIATELATLAQRLRDCTVQVRSRQFSSGSGVIWNADGLIITNAHVAQGEKATVELEDGRVFDAVRTSIDAKLDLAALQVEATDLESATIGNSDALRVGEVVLAVGNPLGAVGVLTTGIIHTLGLTDASNRAVQDEQRTTPNTRNLQPQQWVMADIRLAPGNSGGPLADARGQVIGINTMIAGGLALAVPSTIVERFLKSGSRPYLGVKMRPVLVQLGNKRRLGLLVLEVAKGSLAQSTGLLTGDVLIGVVGQGFNTPDDLLNVLWYAEPGEVLPLEFLRSGKHHQCDVIIPGGKDFAGNIFGGVKSP
jgi:serine protease Do